MERAAAKRAAAASLNLCLIDTDSDADAVPAAAAVASQPDSLLPTLHPDPAAARPVVAAAGVDPDAASTVPFSAQYINMCHCPSQPASMGIAFDGGTYRGAAATAALGRQQVELEAAAAMQGWHQQQATRPQVHQAAAVVVLLRMPPLQVRLEAPQV